MIAVTITATDDPNTWNAHGTGYVFGPNGFDFQIFQEPGKNIFWSTYRFHACRSKEDAAAYVITNNRVYRAADVYDIINA